MIQILDTTSWIFGQANTAGSSGLIGQITKCEFDGVIFYVRENVTGVDSFQISSGERWGDKRGAMPSMSRQSLELAAPAESWHYLAGLIRDVDTLKRPVFKNRNFTIITAEQYFNQST